MFIVSFFRANFVSPWNENARTEQKQQTNWNRAICLVYRTDTNPRVFWLVKRTLGGKKFMPKNCPEINRILRYDVILQHDWPIEQCLLQIGVQQRQRIKNDEQNIFDICKVLYMKKNKFNFQSRWMNDSQGIFLVQLSAPFFSTRSLHRWRRKSLSFNKIINQQQSLFICRSDSLGIRCKQNSLRFLFVFVNDEA